MQFLMEAEAMARLSKPTSRKSKDKKTTAGSSKGAVRCVKLVYDPPSVYDIPGRRVVQQAAFSASRQPFVWFDRCELTAGQWRLVRDYDPAAL